MIFLMNYRLSIFRVFIQKLQSELSSNILIKLRWIEFFNRLYGYSDAFINYIFNRAAFKDITYIENEFFLYLNFDYNSFKIV